MKKPIDGLRDGPRPSRRALRARRRPRHLRQHLCAARSASGTPRPTSTGTYAFVGGGPNACMLGSDGAVYSTQTPTVGAWVAPEPPAAVDPEDDARRQGRDPRHRSRRGEVRRAQRPDLRRRTAGSTSPIPATGTRRPSRIPGRIVVIEKNGDGAHPRGARPRLSERHRRRAGRLDRLGRVLHAATSSAASRTARKTVHLHDAGGPHPRRPQDRRRRQFLDHRRRRRRRRRHSTRTASTSTSSRPAAPSSTACFGKGGKLFCCDMGAFDTSGAAMTGRLIKVDVGVEGMPLFRGAIG